MEKDNFWNDELVAEFTTWSLTESPTYQSRYADIEQFKKLKQQSLIEKQADTLEDFLINMDNVQKRSDRQYFFSWKGIRCCGLITKFCDFFELKIVPINNTDTIGYRKGEAVFKRFNTSVDNKDWEIISLIGDYGGQNNVEFKYIRTGNFYVPELHDYTYGYPSWTLTDVLKNHNGKIHSVRRIRDNSVWTIGDEIVGFGEHPIIKIDNFRIDHFDASLIYASNEYGHGKSHAAWVKAKPVLFVTEDGKSVVENDICWIVTAYSNVYSTHIHRNEKKEDKYKYFSTEEAAKGYVLDNAACLSLNDIKWWLEKYFNYPNGINVSELKGIVKEKTK